MAARQSTSTTNCRGDVRDEHQREPLEQARDRAVRRPHEQHDDEHAVERNADQSRDARHHRGRIRHAAEIRGDVDHIGDDQQGASRPEHPRGIAAPDDARETSAGRQAEACAHQLNRGHERKREQRRPQRQVAEGGAGDGVCGDAGRVVVGGAGDQARAEVCEESPEFVVVGGCGRHTGDTTGSGGSGRSGGSGTQETQRWMTI